MERLIFSHLLQSYCCYHNRNLYDRDDYSILDTVLKEYLPRYFNDVTKGQIQKWQDNFNYKAYNDYITRKLDDYCITVFKKITPRAPMGTRIFDLTQILGTDDIPSTDQLAEMLKNETWT